jgi:hypothetical protein
MHGEAYAAAVARGSEPPLPVDAALVARARGELTGTAPLDRIRSCVVGRLAAARKNRFDPPTARNLRHRAGSLRDLFADQPRVLRWVLSRRAESGAEAPIIPSSCFEEAALREMLQRMRDHERDAARAAWLVAPSPEERGAELAAHLRRIYDEHAREATAAWTAFLEDLKLRRPANEEEEIDLLVAMGEPGWPWWRVLLRVREGVLWPTTSRDDERGARLWKEPATRWAEITGQPPPLRMRFQTMVGFVPPGGQGPLEDWQVRVAQIRERLADTDPEGAGRRRREVLALRDLAAAETEAELAQRDELTRRIWGPLLLDPLRFELPP